MFEKCFTTNKHPNTFFRVPYSLNKHFKDILQTTSYWADESAISILEIKLNIKGICHHLLERISLKERIELCKKTPNFQIYINFLNFCHS